MDNRTAMETALEAAAQVRTRTSPNPWVGAVVLSPVGEVVGVGATQPPGGDHAEVIALRTAGGSAAGGTLVVTLEPCAHQGRTPPCVDAIVAAGVSRVIIAVIDPDLRVAGQGLAALRAGGVDVEVGLLAAAVALQLEPYLHHRRTGRPYVVCKLATTIDGGIAAVDGSSRWITGVEARTDAHQLRAESDAIIVGAGTIRCDDPSLTVRHVDGRDPLRVVLGTAPAGAKVRPCLEWNSDLPALLDDLGRQGVLQATIEGGSRTVRSFFDLDLIDRYVLYVAPALLTGAGMVPMIAGPSTASMESIWRGRFAGVRPVGPDLRIDLIPTNRSNSMARPAHDAAIQGQG